MTTGKKYFTAAARIGGALLLAVAVVLGGRGLWEKWYAPLQVQAKPEFLFSETVLIDPGHPVPADYSPDLVQVGNIFVNRIAASSWQRMTEAAAKNGVSVSAVLGYCGSEESSRVQSGESSGARPSCRAPALQNEHSLGLAIDVGTDETGLLWLQENMYKYGFVLRYPENKEAITGVAAQPQHLRFVGTEAAKIMTKKKIVLEEYLALLSASGTK